VNDAGSGVSEQPARGASRGAFGFIFVTVLLDMMALGVVIPVLPKLVESFLNNDTAAAARWFGLFGTVWALMQFLFSPMFGALSDRFGRRPIVLMSNFGLAFDYVLMALAPSLWWLFLGRLISGITAASVTTAFAYIADVTAPEKRAAAFGLIGAAFGAGFVLGPAIGGLLGGLDPRLPFWLAAGFSFANALYGLFILPESLPRDRRAPFKLRNANPVGALQLLRANPGLLGLAGINFVSQLAHAVLPSAFVLYAGHRYGWDATMVGITLALVGVCSIVVQSLLIGPFVKRFGERRSALLGFAFGAAGFAVYALAPSGYLSWLGIPLQAMWGLSSPSIQALMSRVVSPTQQGQLQGANNSVASIAQLFGPGIFTLTLAWSVGSGVPMWLSGAPFLLAAAMLAGAGALSVILIAKPREVPLFAVDETNRSP
jgi:MFS transporter, DHA1 family, tetracycline resistance protein